MPKISLKSAYFTLKLQCPYCGQTPLQKSWLAFAQGCPKCQYAFEREVGYYTGASQMVLFPAVIGFGIICGVMGYSFGLKGLWLAAISSIAMVVSALVFFPWSQALWLLMDHFFHPLNKDDIESWRKLN
jgi:uncharacterized protein (DUF983 family)